MKGAPKQHLRPTIVAGEVFFKIQFLKIAENTQKIPAM